MALADTFVRGQPLSTPGCHLQRTGIRQRHILGRDENLSDHAAKSAQLALEMAGVAPEDVDMILLATSSPDDLFGSACQVTSGLCDRGSSSDPSGSRWRPS